MQMEFRLCQHFLKAHDFYEGVRAVLLERDNNPVWSPNRLGEISAEDVESYFAELKEGDLRFEDVQAA
jgi:enoyl-CoA hydratase